MKPQHTTSYKYGRSTATSLLLLATTISLIIFSCEELEPVNPADPAYTLDPPTLLSVEALTDTQIEITWKNNEEHTKEFVVQRKFGSGAYSTIVTVAKNILTFTDTACVLGTEYDYVVQSKVESNVSANSNTLKKVTTFPGPGSLNVIGVSDESVRLTWTDNSGFESGFKIERDTGSGFTEIGTVSSDVTGYTDTGLTFGQSYTYRVAAFTSVNTSTWATITAVTEFPAPSNLSASSVSDSELLLTWTDNTGYESGFTIERDAGGGFAEIVTVSSDVTDYTDTGLTFSQDYSYRVAAFTSVNISSWATITAATEFPAPTNLSASSVSDSEILLTWTDNTGYEAGFKIERDAGSGFTEVGTVLSDVTNYTNTGLTLGASYSYRVAAYTLANTSSWATITAATEFPAPSNLSATAISDSEIELTWTDNTGYETGFLIERDNGSGFTELGTVSANVTEYADTGLPNGQNYSYRAAAFTAMNTSDYSVTATASTSVVVDIDGNLYETIQIGDQVWMAENLKVTHYRDGTAIPNLTDAGGWTNTSSGAYCIYNNNASNEVDSYGALYNWYAVNDSRNIAPSGWHVPSDDEWKELEMALGMSQSEADATGYRGTNEGSKLAGNAALWASGVLKNDSEFGSSGFTALPGGYRYYSYGNYLNIGDYGYFWSATETNSFTAWYRLLNYYSSDVYRLSSYKRFGFAVRLLRD